MYLMSAYDPGNSKPPKPAAAAAPKRPPPPTPAMDASGLPEFGFHTTSGEVMTALNSFARDKTYMVTGTSPGSLGAETALSLARASPPPAHIILLSRSREKTAPLMAEMAAIAPSMRVTFVPCDLSEPDSVRAAAKAILEDATTPVIDVLINNAGSILKTFSKNSRGVEMQLATNLCGPFLLTNLILPKIVAAGQGRIVNLSSMCHQVSPFRFHDPQFSNGAAYDPWSSYGQSKTAGILFTVELARRLAPFGVRVYAVHPGVIRTNLRDNGVTGKDLHWLRPITLRNTGIDTFAKPFEWDLTDLAQGAATTLVAALDPRLEGDSGKYLDDCKVGAPMPYACDEAAARVLWVMTEGWVGQRFDVGSDQEDLERTNMAHGHVHEMEMIRARL
jgi:NAD(P)-dependent dehydrogenase (short-subunit alcohol dehydrogenase family)